MAPAALQAPPAAFAVPAADRRLSRPLLWLTVFGGGFAVFEPSPFEFGFALLCWALLIEGIRFPPLLAIPFVLMAVLFNVGGILSLTLVEWDSDAVIFTASTVYLSATLIVFAALIAEDPAGTMRLVRRAYVAAAAVAAALGVFGYFSGSDLFMLNERASGPFKDPNVFGPFLVLPALFLMQEVLTFSPRRMLAASLPLGLLVAGILLSFSRAAWGLFVFSGTLLVYLTLVTTPSPAQRMRTIVGAVLAALAALALLAALTAIPEVRSLLTERTGAQYYDVGEMGRFGKHRYAIPELLVRPLGFGPLEFGKIFAEDPHNVYVNAFAAYGWLGGFSYLAFVATTLFVGAPALFTTAPWRDALVAAYAAFAGTVLVGIVIDTDHWRHFYLMAAIVWGLAAANAAWTVPATGASASSVRTTRG